MKPPLAQWHRRGLAATEAIVLLILVAIISIGLFRAFGDTVGQKFADGGAQVKQMGEEAPEQVYDPDGQSGSKEGAGARASAGSQGSAKGGALQNEDGYIMDGVETEAGEDAQGEEGVDVVGIFLLVLGTFGAIIAFAYYKRKR